MFAFIKCVSNKSAEIKLRGAHMYINKDGNK